MARVGESVESRRPSARWGRPPTVHRGGCGASCRARSPTRRRSGTDSLQRPAPSDRARRAGTSSRSAPASTARGWRRSADRGCVPIRRRSTYGRRPTRRTSDTRGSGPTPRWSARGDPDAARGRTRGVPALRTIARTLLHERHDRIDGPVGLTGPSARGDRRELRGAVRRSGEDGHRPGRDRQARARSRPWDSGCCAVRDGRVGSRCPMRSCSTALLLRAPPTRGSRLAGVPVLRVSRTLVPCPGIDAIGREGRAPSGLPRGVRSPATAAPAAVRQRGGPTSSPTTPSNGAHAPRQFMSSRSRSVCASDSIVGFGAAPSVTSTSAAATRSVTATPSSPG